METEIMGNETRTTITLPTTIIITGKEIRVPVAMRVSSTTNLCGKKLENTFNSLGNLCVDLIYLNKDIISCDLKAIKCSPWQIYNNEGFIPLSFA